MFQPSKYQKNIFNHIEQDVCNIVINAVAGSGKTTTIVEGLKYIPSHLSASFFAFNKSIVESLKGKVPNNVNVQTLHSLGATLIFKNRRKSKLNNYKINAIIEKISEHWSLEDEQKTDYDYKQRVKKLVDLIRLNLIESVEDLSILAQKHELEIIDQEIYRAFKVLEHVNADTSQHDFVDMLYLPVINNWDGIKYDFVFVDECQDLNIVQQKLINLVMKENTRLVAVGDPAQAIYGFAGADVDSFKKLISRPMTKELPLSVNYRCGKNIIALAKTINPNIEAYENSIDGEVNFEASIKEITYGDMVLCRNTVPLVKLCLGFISSGKKAYVKGGDIGLNLINLIKKSKVHSISELILFLDEEKSYILHKLITNFPYLSLEDVKELPSYQLLLEKVLVIKTIIENEDNVVDVQSLIKYIELLFSDSKEGICFSTIHKAKGLEAENVFIVDKFLMPSKFAKKDWQKDQEKNLEYVAYTRAKKYLGFIKDWSFFEKNQKSVKQILN